MLLSSKHAREVTVVKGDFRGGLNNSVSQDAIADNQLSRVVNMDLEPSTGLLRTAHGTKTLLLLPEGIVAFAVLYDRINAALLIVSEDREVYLYDIRQKTLNEESLGTLTGSLKPIAAGWEDGLLIASGGLLQYYNGVELKTIEGLYKEPLWDGEPEDGEDEEQEPEGEGEPEEEPEPDGEEEGDNEGDEPDGDDTQAQGMFYPAPLVCNGVYVRNGRVLVFYDDVIRYSAIGDEEDWSGDNFDPSSSKFLNVGYKEGGAIVGLMSMSSDVLIIKDNRKVYRLTGEYPDWQVVQLSSTIGCNGRSAYCAIANEALILGGDSLQRISTTNFYGDMLSADAGVNVRPELPGFSDNASLVFLPSLNQAWLFNGLTKVLVYDLTFNAFFFRDFNSAVTDVVQVAGEVVVVKKHRLNVIAPLESVDDERNLVWHFRAKLDIAVNDFLVKRAILNVKPYTDRYYDAKFYVSGFVLESPVRAIADFIYNNPAPVYLSERSFFFNRRRVAFNTGERVYRNPVPIYENPLPLFQLEMLRTDERCVVRCKAIDVSGVGQGGGIVLNSLILQVVKEV